MNIQKMPTLNRQKKRTLIRQIKDCLIEYALTRTSIYGLSNILKAKFVIGKIFWTFILAFLSGFLGYQTVYTLANYFSYEVFTKTQYHPEVLSRFPEVTICNQNPFITEYSNQFLSFFFNQSLVKDVLQNDSQILWKKLLGIKNTITYKAYYSNNDINKKKFGYKINETILRCSFNMAECDLNEFEWGYNPIYGNCYTFNAVKHILSSDTANLKNVSMIGKGLQLDLFVGYNQTEYNSVFNQGAHIIIRNQSDFLVATEIDVSVGFQTNIGIQRTFTSKKEFPFSKCQMIDSNQNYKFARILIDYGFMYHQATCYIFCIFEYFVKKCSCFLPGISIFDSIAIKNETRICKHFEDLNCFMSYFDYLYGSADKMNICPEDCPLECNSLKFLTTTSQFEYPSKGFANIMKRDPLIQEKFNNSSNISYEDLKQSLVSLNIYYDDLGYTTLEEIPKIDFNTLISNLGGNLGLFLGASVLSLFEIFEILFLILKIIYEKLTTKIQISSS